MVVINDNDLTVDAIETFIFCKAKLNKQTLITRNSATKKGHLTRKIHQDAVKKGVKCYL